eukprot:1103068-Pleurochrysis_carterae.AAC.2
MMRVVTVMCSQPQLAQCWMNEAFGIPIKSLRRLYTGLGRDPSSQRYCDAFYSLVRACELVCARVLLARATESLLWSTLHGDALAHPDKRLTNSMTAARPHSSPERGKGRFVSSERVKVRLVTSNRG